MPESGPWPLADCCHDCQHSPWHTRRISATVVDHVHNTDAAVVFPMKNAIKCQHITGKKGQKETFFVEMEPPTLWYPSRRTLCTTWQNFQQTMGFSCSGSLSTMLQKVCAPFSWKVPMMVPWRELVFRSNKAKAERTYPRWGRQLMTPGPAWCKLNYMSNLIT